MASADLTEGGAIRELTSLPFKSRLQRGDIYSELPCFIQLAKSSVTTEIGNALIREKNLDIFQKMNIFPPFFEKREFARIRTSQRSATFFVIKPLILKAKAKNSFMKILYCRKVWN